MYDLPAPPPLYVNLSTANGAVCVQVYCLMLSLYAFLRIVPNVC